VYGYRVVAMMSPSESAIKVVAISRVRRENRQGSQGAVASTIDTMLSDQSGTKKDDESNLRLGATAP